jgi:hypothetical protein
MELGKHQIRVTGETALNPKLVEMLIVKGTEFGRQTTKSPDESELRGDDVNDKTEPRFLCKRETMLGFTLHLNERILLYHQRAYPTAA